MYADTAGNIFYFYGGTVPRRDPKFDWTKPVDGSDPATDSKGYHAPGDLPQVLNPKSGWMQNTNSIPFLADLDDRIEADATVGAIDSAAFVATTIDSAVTSYFKAIDEIEEAVEHLDARALTRTDGSDVLADLVALRRRIARLRRVLSSQRDVFAAFRTPDFGVIATGQGSEAFHALAVRFDDALQSVDDSRDGLLGSFDIFMTRTGQRTNEIMKILALATVLLLPGSLIAGLLGMNVTVPLDKDDPMSFWLVLGMIALLAAVVLIGARVRRWI